MHCSERLFLWFERAHSVIRDCSYGLRMHTVFRVIIPLVWEGMQCPENWLYGLSGHVVFRVIFPMFCGGMHCPKRLILCRVDMQYPVWLFLCFEMACNVLGDCYYCVLCLTKTDSKFSLLFNVCLPLWTYCMLWAGHSEKYQEHYERYFFIVSPFIYFIL